MSVSVSQILRIWLPAARRAPHFGEMRRPWNRLVAVYRYKVIERLEENSLTVPSYRDEREDVSQDTFIQLKVLLADGNGLTHAPDARKQPVTDSHGHGE